MSNCSIFCHKITKKRHFYSNSKICTQCITNIKECNYNITIKENGPPDAENKSNDTQNTSLHNVNDEDDLTNLITLDCSWKTVSITNDKEMDIEEHDIAFNLICTRKS